MRRLRQGHLYWRERQPHRLIRLPRLTGDHDADVVVIGGGITGCACAYLFANSGLRVTLVEAREIGCGSTAASTALLMQEPDVDFAVLSDRYGMAAASRMWKRSRQAVRALLRTLAEIDATATVERTPSIYLAHEREIVPDLRHELTLRHRAGLGGRWLSPAALEAHTGFTGAGGILTIGNALLDPYRASVALARAAIADGAQLFRRSRVVRVRQTEEKPHGGVRVETERGTIKARRVVVATGYATADFKPLAGRFRMFHTFVAVTERLTPRQRHATGLRNVMFWDTGRPYHYLRWTADHRLIFGGHDRPHTSGAPTPHETRATTKALLDDLGALYPTLRGVGADYAWHGLFATTSDGLPYIGSHRRYPHHLFALGYAGNGITFGYLAAQMLTRALHGRSLADDELFAFDRRERLRRPGAD
jgi:glycine/D-amino acid oxidase-like deaminating enzyme